MLWIITKRLAVVHACLYHASSAQVCVTWCRTAQTVKESSCPHPGRRPEVPASSALNLLCDFLDLSSFLFKTHVFGAHNLKDLFWLCCDICLRQSLPHLLTPLSKMLSTLFYSYSIFQEKGQFFFGHSLPWQMPSFTLGTLFP